MPDDGLENAERSLTGKYMTLMKYMFLPYLCLGLQITKHLILFCCLGKQNRLYLCKSQNPPGVLQDLFLRSEQQI